MRNPEQVKADYFDWLCDVIGVERGDDTYLILAGDLFKTYFKVVIPEDERRVQDAIELRDEYIYDVSCGYGDYLDMPTDKCTILELLIALSRRMDFELSGALGSDDQNASAYFWDMLTNLALLDFTDDSYYDISHASTKVRERLGRFVDRTYCSDGRGSPFPLRYSGDDMRHIELWQQMQRYITENYPI